MLRVGRWSFFTTETPKFWEVFLMSFFDVFVAGKKREAKKVLSKKLFSMFWEFGAAKIGADSHEI